MRSSLCLSFFFSPELDFFLALGVESRLAKRPPLFLAVLASLLLTMNLGVERPHPVVLGRGLWWSW